VVGQCGGVMARRERRGAAEDEGEHTNDDNVHLRRVYDPYIPKETNCDDQKRLSRP
jgi:hypothetical protein